MATAEDQVLTPEGVALAMRAAASAPALNPRQRGLLAHLLVPYATAPAPTSDRCTAAQAASPADGLAVPA